MSNRLLFFLLFLLVFGLTSCRPKYNPTPKVIILNDFESVKGWASNVSNNSQTVCSEDSHSGKYSYKIDKYCYYGYFYKQRVSDITDKKISCVRISGYCKVKSKGAASGNIVCALEDKNNKMLLWQNHSLNEFVWNKNNTWIYFEKIFDLSSNINPDVLFSSNIIISNPNDVLFIDDYKIEFY